MSNDEAGAFTYYYRSRRTAAREKRYASSLSPCAMNSPAMAIDE
jgi:hypothetical protein